MKKTTLILLLALLPLAGMSQLNYSKVKIFASDAELVTISNLGVTVDHGKHKSNTWFVTDLSSTDIAILEENGYSYEILIDNVSAYYLEHSNDPIPPTYRDECSGETGGGYDPETPENFDLGSMGGYFTYEEYLAELDAMRAAYPELITEKDGISDFETWEGRPIHWVRISDNADTDEEEEEVMYTSIHHAREPMSLSQTIFYMWYLLENYGTDEEVTYLVDNTEMYFVPMINPDGYKYNHTTNPGGGGMHRKNRNPEIGSTNGGVDLNRNYGYHWNESGTSPDEDSDVFAGEGPFSEPETQAIRWFCENHNFKYAFNAHAHGDLLLFPLGWATGAFAEDHDYFQEYSIHMAENNGYDPVKSTDLYPAAGDSDDWMYADDLDEKPEIFAMTPEVGDAFWPPSAAIVPTCKEMIWPNLIMAHLPHIYGDSRDLELSRIEETTGYFNYDIRRLGLTDGDITVSITPLLNIESVGGENVHTMTLNELQADSISFELASGISFGDEIIYVLETGTDAWTRKDTITKTYGTLIEVFADDASDLLHWSGDWDITDEDSYSPSTCITDSPYDGTYGNNRNDVIECDEVFDISDATYAYVNFWAKWEIETDYDYVEFMISTDGGSSWEALCGNYTNPGVPDQDFDEPLYDGIQNDWVFEEVDLSGYIGATDVRFRFILISDAFVSGDGYYFDDFTLSSDAGQVGVEEEENFSFSLYPNPANDMLNIRLNSSSEIETITLKDQTGRIIRTFAGTETTLALDEIANGMYFVTITDESGAEVTKPVVIKR